MNNTESTYGRYSQDKYHTTWKTINIRPATKELLKELAEYLSSDTAEAPMATVLDNLIKAKHAEVFKK